MKTHSALVLVGLAISFVVPTFAQQKDTANPRIAQQRDLVGDPTALDEFGVLATQQSEAFTNKDAPAVAALFTEDAVLVAPDGIFSGRQAIEKRYEGTFQQWPFTFFNDLRDRHLKAIDNAVWSFGEWGGTLHGQTGPAFVNGYFSAIYIREGDAWKIRMLTLTERPRLAASAETK
jgi:ketosteroid isomerase-like protein